MYMLTPSQIIYVKSKIAQESNENENSHNEIDNENALKEIMKYWRILNSVNTNELECPLHTQENYHLTCNICAPK